MKISIVIPVLNSHKVVIRQIRHFKKMSMPENVELIIVDDGSNPPIPYTAESTGLKNLRVLFTNDKRPWTQGLARNMGAREAKGEYLFFTDIDHIITKEAVDAVLKFDGDKMTFPRYFGIFDRYGNILYDRNTLIKFGLASRYRKSLYGGTHGNTYAIRRKIFEEMGGYNPKYCETGFHVGGKHTSEEGDLNHRYGSLVRRKKVKSQVTGPIIYVYPTSKFRTDKNENPGGLFHKLSLEQKPQPMKE